MRPIRPERPLSVDAARLDSGKAERSSELVLCPAGMFPIPRLESAGTRLRTGAPIAPEGIVSRSRVAPFRRKDFVLVVTCPSVRSRTRSGKARGGTGRPLAPRQRIATFQKIAGFRVRLLSQVARMSPDPFPNRASASGRASAPIGPAPPITVAQIAVFVNERVAHAIVSLGGVFSVARAVFPPRSRPATRRAARPFGPSGPIGADILHSVL